MLARTTVTVVLLLPLVGCGSGITLNLTQTELQTGIDAFFPINSDDYVEENLPVRLTLSDPAILLENGSDRIGLKINVAAETTDAAPEIPALPSAPSQAASGAPRPIPPGPLSGPKPPGGPPPFAPPPQAKPVDTPTVPSDGNKSPGAPPENFDGAVTVSGKIAYRAEEGAFYFLEPSIDEISFQELPGAMDEPVRKVTGKLLTKYLTENAVYTLSDEDTKLKAAKMLLKSVSVQDGKIKVELGP